MSKTLMAAWLLGLGVLVSNADASTVTYSTAQSEFNGGILNQGWWSSGPGHENDTNNDNHFTGLISGDTLRSFYTFDLSGLSDTITAASLRVQRGTQSGTVNLGLWDVASNAATVNNNTGLNSTIFDDLGSGNSYGTYNVLNGGFSDYLTFNLNAQALADINAAVGFFTLGASVDAGQFIFSNTGGDVTFLDLTVSDQLSVPEPMSLALLGLGLFGIAVTRRSRPAAAS